MKVKEWGKHRARERWRENQRTRERDGGGEKTREITREG